MTPRANFSTTQGISGASSDVSKKYQIVSGRKIFDNACLSDAALRLQHKAQNTKVWDLTMSTTTAANENMTSRGGKQLLAMDVDSIIADLAMTDFEK